MVTAALPKHAILFVILAKMFCHTQKRKKASTVSCTAAPEAHLGKPRQRENSLKI